jgi:sec-independent protein translocase protein TatA
MGLSSPWHVAILLVVLLLVFGASRLPEMGKSLGKGMREFKSGITGEDEKPQELVQKTEEETRVNS